MASIAGLLQALFVGREHGWRARARRRPAPTAPVADPQDASSHFAADYTDVLASEELAEGAVVEVFVDSSSVALCRSGGRAYAVCGICPHAEGPLADGTLQGTVLTCPVHGWQFDVATGHCLVDADKPVQTYDVVEKQGRIAVRRGSSKTSQG